MKKKRKTPTNKEIALYAFSGLMVFTCIMLAVIAKVSREDVPPPAQESVSYMKIPTAAQQNQKPYDFESAAAAFVTLPGVTGSFTAAAGNTQSYIPGQQKVEPTNNAPQISVPYSVFTPVQSAPAAETPAAPAQVQGLPNTAGWGKAEILNYLAQSVNKTKQRTDSFGVHHTESFSAEIKECTGGSIGKWVANVLMGYVVKPSEEDYAFSNGRCTTQEGETVDILLPKHGAFSLPADGAASATVGTEGGLTVIKVKLIEEDCGISDVPQYNKNAIGYLNPAEFDLMGIEITDAQINYLGSSITVKIDANGYVKFAEYKIPLYVSGKGAKGSISGYAVFNGEQTETWEF